MFEWVDRIPFWLRAALSTLSYLGVWIAFSLPPLLNNQPEAFQAAGSIVVAWGVLFIGTKKIQYETSLRIADEVMITSALNRLEAHRRISDERTELTFDVHMLQIAQISAHSGVPNTIGPQSPEEIQDLSESIQQRTSKGMFRPPPPEDEQATKALTQLKSIRSKFDPWVKLMWRMELTFVIFGTLQWGYGNHWAVALYEFFAL